MSLCVPDRLRQERQRLDVLAELDLVDAPLDPLLQKVCDLACSLFDVSTAFVSIVDETERHIIAFHGSDFGRLPRHETVCNLVIQSDTPFIVGNALDVPQFASHPLVAGPKALRFFAGVPFSMSPGVRLGSFCLTDERPRTLTPGQIEALERMTALVLGQITHHRSKKILARQTLDLARKQAILSQTATFAKVGGFEANPATGAMAWSDELHRLCDLDAASAPTLPLFLARFDSDTRALLSERFARLAEQAGEFDLDTTFVAADGSLQHVHIHAETRAMDGDDTIVGIVQDITERKSALSAVEWIATHDSLTKLSNRPAFNDHIQAAVDRADQFGHRAALVMLDIDRFKTVNDTLGHDAGDAVLVAVADRLVQAVGSRGIVARIGGDEFAVLVGRFEAEGAIAALATDILLCLRKPFEFNGYGLGTRATLGVAVSSLDEPTSAASLFKNADIALYNAKQAGRDGFAFYRSAMRDELEGRLDKLAVARAAVVAGRIEPYYQPKVCLETGTIKGFEALLRWHHPTKGLCAPDEMGDAFSDNELAILIGRGMFQRVVADMLAWQGLGLTTGPIAINVAGPEFYAGDFAKRILSGLDAVGLPTDSIEIEITESVFLGHRSGVVGTTLRQLAQAGIAIALDDFGTGYASLTQLKQYPVSTIKIDRSFVTDIENDPDAAKIVDAVASLAESLQLGIVAEGIETQAQADFLRQHRSVIGQGYLFAKPMPASRVLHFVRTWSMPAPKSRLRRATVGR